MKTISAISACALLALTAPAFAQNNTDANPSKSLQQNASPNGPGAAHEKQSGSADTQGGPSPQEGRTSATDSNGATTNTTK